MAVAVAAMGPDAGRNSNAVGVVATAVADTADGQTRKLEVGETGEVSAVHLGNTAEQAANAEESSAGETIVVGTAEMTEDEVLGSIAGTAAAPADPAAAVPQGIGLRTQNTDCMPWLELILVTIK